MSYIVVNFSKQQLKYKKINQFLLTPGANLDQWGLNLQPGKLNTPHINYTQVIK